MLLQEFSMWGLTSDKNSNFAYALTIETKKIELREFS